MVLRFLQTISAPDFSKYFRAAGSVSRAVQARAN
jgi:hypothetical protein